MTTTFLGLLFSAERPLQGLRLHMLAPLDKGKEAFSASFFLLFLTDGAYWGDGNNGHVSLDRKFRHIVALNGLYGY